MEISDSGKEKIFAKNVGKTKITGPKFTRFLQEKTKPFDKDSPCQYDKLCLPKMLLKPIFVIVSTMFITGALKKEKFSLTNRII
jgi:hypothetical protein